MLNNLLHMPGWEKPGNNCFSSPSWHIMGRNLKSCLEEVMLGQNFDLLVLLFLFYRYFMMKSR